MKKNSRIFISGHSGIIAKALLNLLKKEGFNKLITRTPLQLDLTNQRAVCSFFKKEKPEYCFLPSIIEGGIAANIAYPAELIYQNLIAQTNIIHSAWELKVKKLLFFASSCSYPKNCPQPMKEEYLLSGRLESTNEPYAVAKIAGIKMCQAYNRQYGMHFISVIPATVYGPNDDFDLKNSHVVSALIRRIHEAKINRKPKVKVWGTGKPRREFIYADDLIDASLFLMRQNNSLEVVNIGVGTDISIRKLAEAIKRIVGFDGIIEFDNNKPDGATRKILDTSLLSSLGWQPRMELHLGLEHAYYWYQKIFLT